MRILFRSSSFAIIALTLLLGFTSCEDKEDVAPNLTGDVAINQWINDVMNEVYYWLDNMRTPIALTSDPEDFFESLLFRPTDRFSVIYPDYQELVNSLQGIEKEAGYEFSLVRESSSSNNVLAFITYVKRGSPAATSGVRRGDVIYRINGQLLNIDNYRTLLGQTDEAHSITFTRFNSETEKYEGQAAIDLQTITVAENPNFLDTVYTIDNQKIGYVVYHFFAPGIDGQPTSYDDQMDEIFGRFKSEGINHLIVDFRYNSGGYVSSAINLASLIAPNANNTNIFAKTRYNSFLMGFDQFKDSQTPFKNKAQNLGPILTGNKLYILTSGRTASASELIINGLNPYMDITLIGGQTYGKNVGSVALQDEENPENAYGLLPIISQSFNSEDKSDYGTGFTPNIIANEMSQPVLLPLGDTNEYLLRLAISQITGQPIGARIKENLVDRIDFGSSLEKQVRYGRMIEDQIQFGNR